MYIQPRVLVPTFLKTLSFLHIFLQLCLYIFLTDSLWFPWSLCVVCRECGIENTIRRSRLLVNWRASIKLTKSFQFKRVFFFLFLQNKTLHEKIETNILDHCFLRLRNIEGYTFPRMIDFKTLCQFWFSAHKNLFHYCKKYFSIPQKTPFVFDSSVLSPQSSLPLQISQRKMHLPLLHWKGVQGWHDGFPKCTKKSIDN